jgi:hypothetical protein
MRKPSSIPLWQTQNCPLNIECMVRTSPSKIFCLVSTLFGLKKTDNLYEFNYLYPNQTFSKFPQKIVHLFYLHFCLTAVKSGRELAKLLSQAAFLTFLTYLTYLTYPTYLTYLPNFFKTSETVQTSVGYRLTVLHIKLVDL